MLNFMFLAHFRHQAVRKVKRQVLCKTIVQSICSPQMTT